MAGEVVIGLFRGGLLGRALSWSVLGLGIGLGQGLADRSRERMVYGLIGGGLGGFIGGFLFEWLRVALGDRYDAESGGGDHDPGCSGWACAWPWSNRCSAGSGFKSSAADRRGASIFYPTRRAAWVSTNEPRSASSVTPRSRAGTLRSRRLRGGTSCTAWPRKVQPVSTDQSSPIHILCRMETGSSWDVRSWCFISAEADRFRMTLAPQIQNSPTTVARGLDRRMADRPPARRCLRGNDPDVHPIASRHSTGRHAQWPAGYATRSRSREILTQHQAGSHGAGRPMRICSKTASSTGFSRWW